MFSLSALGGQRKGSLQTLCKAQAGQCAAAESLHLPGYRRHVGRVSSVPASGLLSGPPTVAQGQPLIVREIPGLTIQCIYIYIHIKVC